MCLAVAASAPPWGWWDHCVRRDSRRKLSSMVGTRDLDMPNEKDGPRCRSRCRSRFRESVAFRAESSAALELHRTSSSRRTSSLRRAVSTSNCRGLSMDLDELRDRAVYPPTDNLTAPTVVPTGTCECWLCDGARFAAQTYLAGLASSGSSHLVRLQARCCRAGAEATGAVTSVSRHQARQCCRHPMTVGQ